MKWLFVFFVVVINSAVADDWTEEAIEKLFSQDVDEATAPLPEVVAKYNYTIEVHNVTTDDGYILEMHRIPATPTSPAVYGKPIAFLMHGLTCSSDVWIMMGPGKSLAYVLADAGYDVWMGNARGDSYSKHHNTTSKSSKEFWNFSWHEIGIYDLPAMMDYALDTTGQEKMVFIGHSQGVTTFLVMASEIPSYNDKIKAMFALGPTAYIGHLYSPAVKLAVKFTKLLERAGVYKVFDTSRLPREVSTYLCENDVLSQFLCSNVIFLVAGFDKAQLNVSLLPTITGHLPSSASTLQIVHYGQGIKSHKFRQFDHGSIKNLWVYGSLTPPDYDMSKVTAPVHLLYGDNDWLTAPEDVAQLYNELANPVEMLRIANKNWTHGDFLWGIDVKTLVYDPILETLEAKYRD